MTPRFDPAAPVIVDPPAIVRADTSRAEELAEQLIKMDRSMATNEFEMADLWAEFQAGDYYHANHCQTLPEFVKKHGFQLSAREITYRIKVSRIGKKLGVTLEQKMKAQWSKLKKITELDPAATYTMPEKLWLDTNGHADLSDLADKEIKGEVVMQRMFVNAANGQELKKLKTLVSKIRKDPENELIFETIAYMPDQKVIIDQAVALVTAQSGDTVDTATEEEKQISRGTAYERMAADFISDPNNHQDVENMSGETSTFNDVHVVRDDEGREYETGA